MRLFAIGSFFAFIVSTTVACSHDHGGAYATYQKCFDDHTMEESLPFQEAVVICCSEHEIGSTPMPACGTTSAECVTYLGANLTTTATSAEIQAACDEYVTVTGM